MYLGVTPLCRLLGKCKWFAIAVLCFSRQCSFRCGITFPCRVLLLVQQGSVQAICKHCVSILCEFSGTHDSFYEKFRYRHHMSTVLEYLWKLPEYKQIIKSQASSENFVRFVNMIINDSIYSVDEAINHLTEIHDIEELQKSDQWSTMSDAERGEKDKVLRQSSRTAKYMLQNANEVIGMIHFLSEEIVEPFMRPELADRIASMLDDWLLHLVGPKMNSLKVQNPEKYNFRPKELLSRLCDVYMHFSASAQFAPAVAHDGRSYRPENFDKAADILHRQALRDAGYIQNFRAFAAQVKEAASTEMTLEEQLGEIPDEFLDPITQELMKDPVKLPSSGAVVDRSTITRHLLSDQTDPFNRSFLSLDMVHDATDSALLKQIEDFISSKKSGPMHIG